MKDFVKVRDLGYSYSSRKVLRHISFNLERGSVCSIAGASGSGKSTLLALLAGELVPDAGSISLEGTSYHQQREDLVPGHQRVALMRQQAEILQMLTPLELVERRGRGAPQSLMRKIAHRGWEALELGEVRSHPLKILSGGEQQRVALLATLAADPALLLLDEPFNQLDYGLKQKTLSFLREEFPQLTTILVSHDPSELLPFSGHLMILKDGQIEQEGSPREVFHSPASLYAAELLGPINQLSPAQATALGLRDGDIRLIRPQHLSISKEGVSAQVVETRFSGSVTYLKVQADGGLGCLWMVAAGQPLEAGTRVRIQLKKPLIRR